jgi:hypothetical protein
LNQPLPCNAFSGERRVDFSTVGKIVPSRISSEANSSINPFRDAFEASIRTRKKIQSIFTY